MFDSQGNPIDWDKDKPVDESNKAITPGNPGDQPIQKTVPGPGDPLDFGQKAVPGLDPNNSSLIKFDNSGNPQKVVEQNDVPISDGDLSDIEKELNASGRSFAQRNADRQVYYVNGEKIDSGVSGFNPQYDAIDVPPPPTTKAVGFKPPKTEMGPIEFGDAMAADLRAKESGYNILKIQ